MKKLLIIASLLFAFASQAQVFIKTGTSISATIPTSAFDQLRTENGLISHRVSGTVGSFGATDQWIGIGRPLTNLYGLRVQWNQQTFNYSLRQAASGKNAIIEWGNQGGEMQLRYITNPTDSNGFIKILNLTSTGNAYVGNQNSGNFTNPKFEVNPATAGQLAIASKTSGVLGNSFLNVSTQTDVNTVSPAIRIQAIPGSGAQRTDGLFVTATGSNTNIGLISTATNGTNFNLGIQASREVQVIKQAKEFSVLQTEHPHKIMLCKE